MGVVAVTVAPAVTKIAPPFPRPFRPAAPALPIGMPPRPRRAELFENGELVSGTLPARINSAPPRAPPPPPPPAALKTPPPQPHMPPGPGPPRPPLVEPPP